MTLLDNKKVLITGGTGSFGQEFLKQVLEDRAWGNPQSLIVASRDEFRQLTLKQKYDEVQYFLGDIRDSDFCSRICKHADVVIHAAALKQVTMGEENPSTFIGVNIDGTQNLLNASQGQVETFLLLSTDKAVEPVNLYGATKMIAEKLVTRESWDIPYRKVVRYGNVAGSKGSVIPAFLELKRKGLPFRVTSPEMTRFWITLPEAVNFALESLTYGHNLCINVPELPKVTIMDICAAIDPYWPVDHVGIRPGEKIHEALIGKIESLYTSIDYDRFFYAVHPQKVGDTQWEYNSDMAEESVSIDAIRDEIERLGGLL